MTDPPPTASASRSGDEPARRRSMLWPALAAAVVLTAMVAVLVVQVLTAAGSDQRARRAAERSLQVLDVSQLSEREVVDLETGVRGYAATLDRSYLQPWYVAQAALPDVMWHLQTLVEGDSAQVQRVRGLAGAISYYLNSYTLRFVGDPQIPDHATVLTALEHGRVLLDGIGDRFASFNQAERSLQASRDRSAVVADARLQRIAVGAGLALLLGVVGLLWIVFRSIVRPTRRAIDGVVRVSDGEREPGLATDGAGELAQLSHAINQMAAELGTREHAQRLLASLVAQSEDAIISTSTDGTITSFNRGAELLFGHSAQEMMGQPIARLSPPDRAGEDEHLLRTAIADGAVSGRETVRRHRDGGAVDVSITVSPLRDGSDRVIGASVVARDISARMTAERQLRDRERQLVEAQQIAGVGSWEWDLSRPEVAFSDELCRLLGQPVGFAATYQQFIDLVHPDDRSTVDDELDEVRGGQVVRSAYRIVRPDGEIRHVHARRYARLDARGAITHVQGTIQDITEQHALEAERRRAQEQFERAFADAPIGVALVATDGRWLRANRALGEMLGCEPDDLEGRTLSERTHHEDREGDLAIMRQMLAGERDSFQRDKRYLHRDGHAVWVRLSASLVRDHDGEPLQFVTQIEDITARRAAEEALRASEERFATIVANVPGMVYRFALSPDGKYSLPWVSQGSRELSGVEPEVLMANPEMAIESIHRDDQAEFHRTIAESAATLQRWEWRGRRLGSDGTVMHIHGSSQPHLDQDGTVVWDGVMLNETAVRVAQEGERAARAQLQTVLDNLPGSGVALYDRDLRLTLCAGPLFAGVDLDAMLGRGLPELVRPQTLETMTPGLTAALHEGRTSTAMVAATPHVGRPMAIGFAPYREQEEITGVLVHWRDISTLRAAQSEAELAIQRFRQAFDAAPTGMALIAPGGVIEQANDALGTITGRTRSELEGMALGELLHPADRDRRGEVLGLLTDTDTDADAAGRSIELRFIGAAGPPVDVSVHATRLHGPDPTEDRLLCQFQDVTERNLYESQLRFMADHDPLTGLLNRRKFESELERQVVQVKRYGAEGALIALDLDHFKRVNDTLGHSAGDQLIVSIAGALRGRLREADVLARLGGDEFAVLLTKADAAEAMRVAASIVNTVRAKTTVLEGERRHVTASVGVTLFRAEPNVSADSFLVEADLAMYDAKEAGRDGCAMYASSEHEVSRTQARLTWIQRIERAIEDGRFVLLAQPILDMHAAKVRQHELLIRMLDDHDELIPPATFLHIAERFGLMGRLDEWVTMRAIDLLERQPELQLEVNISGRSLGDQRLLSAIEDRLSASPIDPTRLIFEVTETAAVANLTQAQEFAQRLRDLGCRFALDDFGAGFGSFYYLKHLPFDYVKIDGEFVQHVVSGQVDRLVVEAVVRIAQGLGKETIAEFVTDARTEEMVSRLGVDYAQGYHIGRPAPIEELVGSASGGSP